MYVVPGLATCECLRDIEGIEDEWIAAASPRSVGPAHARNTTSCMLGVNSDNVRFESLSAASRRRFLCENNDWVSAPESRERDAICAASRTLPFESTGSCGGLAKGSVTASCDSAVSDG